MSIGLVRLLDPYGGTEHSAAPDQIGLPDGARDARRAQEALRLAQVTLPPDLLEHDLPGLSIEVRQRTSQIRTSSVLEALGTSRYRSSDLR